MPESRRPNVTAFVLLGIVAIALVAVVIGLVAGGGDDDDDAAGAERAGETRDVHIVGDALPDYAGSADDPAVGQPAPVVEGETFDGDAISVGDGPAVLVFLAHWCPHCQREVPVILDWLASAGAPEGVRLIGVATAIDDSRPNHPPSAWLEREGWELPTLVDDDTGSSSRAYGLSSFPYFVAIDADGNVAARAAGELSPDDLEALLDVARGR